MDRDTQGFEWSKRRQSKRLQAKKAPFDLVHLLRQIPDILSQVPHNTLKVLVQSRRALRSQVHDFITSVTFYHQKGAELLIKTNLRRLRSLRLGGFIQWFHLRWLCLNSWQTVTTLNLDRVALNLPCLELLVEGNWPSLKRLVLSRTNLHAGMEILQQGSWPKLTCLELKKCNMCSDSIAHLTAADWTQLQSLSIGGNHLTAADIGQLSKQWPQLRELQMDGVFCNTVRQLDGKISQVTQDNWQPGEELDPAFMQHISKANWPCLEKISLVYNHLNVITLEMLVQCQWPMLKTLMLCSQPLSAEGCAMLSQGQWPLLESLDLSETQTCSLGMAHIVSAKWPRLKMLSVARNWLDTATYAQLAMG